MLISIVVVWLIPAVVTDKFPHLSGLNNLILYSKYVTV